MESSQNHTATDAALVAATLTDKERFGELVVRYEDRLRRYIRRLGVRDEDDQLDVLQEIFLKVYRNLRSFDPSLSFSSWIYRIAHNEAVSWYRRRNVRPEGHQIADGEEVLQFVAAHEDSAEWKFDRTLNATVLQKALERLEPKYRDVLVLRYFEHKEYTEISDILQLPVGSVGTLIHRGKQHLARAINPDSVRT